MICRMRWSMMVLAWSLCLAWPLQAQCPEDEGWWGYSSVRSLYVPATGPGLLTSGQALVSFDASNPDAPRILGHTWIGGYATVLAVSGDLAVVGSIANGIHLVDQSVPERPERIGHLDVDGVSDGLFLTDHEVVLAVREQLWVADLTDPGQPRLGATIELHGRVGDMDLSGELVAAANGTGLVLVDCADPEKPFVVSELELPGYCNRVRVVGDRAYLTTSSPGKLHEVDFSDPTTPVLLHTVRCPEWSRGLELVGARKLVIAGESALLLYDLDHQDGPRYAEAFIPEQTPQRIATRSDILWLASMAGGVFAIEVPEAAAPLPRGSLKLALTAPSDVAVDGGLVVVADGVGPRLRVFGAGNGGLPAEIAALDLPGNTVSAVALRGPLALASYGSCEGGEHGPICEDEGTAVVDLSEPEEPVLLNFWEGLPGMADEILMGDGFALMQCCTWYVVDLSDPPHPLQVATLDAGPSLSISGRTAIYSKSYGTELCAADLDELPSPHEFGCLELEDRGYSVALDGNLAAVVMQARDSWDDEPQWLQLFELSDAGSLQELGRLEMWGVEGRVRVHGGWAVVDIGAELMVVDLASPHTPQLFGYLSSGQTEDHELEGDSAVVAYSDGIRILNLGACGSSPPQAGFSWSPNLPALGEPVAFEERCSASPSGYEWDFGDGSSSSEAEPIHVFSQPGEHEVQLTVVNSYGSATATETIATQNIGTEAEFVAVIPAAAQAPGIEGTSWRSELVLGRVPYVPSSAEALLYFMPRFRDNTLAAGHRVRVNRILHLDDVVGSTLDAPGGAGAIMVVADEPLRLSSRTFTDDGIGSYGQLVPPVLTDRAVRGGETARLLLLQSTEAFRSNLGMVNLGSQTTPVVVDFFDGDGGVLGSTARFLDPYSSLQINMVLRRHADDFVPQAYAEIRATGPDARVAFYGSVVDNRSGDPTFSEPVFPSDEPLFVPAVAHAPGVNGTEWRSLLQICAVDEARGTISFMPDSAGPGGSWPTVEFELQAGHCLQSGDVVAELFGAEGSGALRIIPDSGSVVASSRTYTESDHGSYGQLIPVVRAAEVPLTTTLVGLQESADPDQGFRTNLGFLNVEDRTAKVVLWLYGQDGVTLRRIEVELLPYSRRQLDRVLGDLGGVDVAWAQVSQAEHGGTDRVVVYGSVVDNRSGDPSFLKGW